MLRVKKQYLNYTSQIRTEGRKELIFCWPHVLMKSVNFVERMSIDLANRDLNYFLSNPN